MNHIDYTVGGFTKRGETLGGECENNFPTLEEAEGYFEFLKTMPATASITIYDRDDIAVKEWMA
jgi:hypothetical protein